MDTLFIIISAILLTAYGLGGFDDFEKESGWRKTGGKCLAIFCFFSIGIMAGLALAEILAS